MDEDNIQNSNGDDSSRNHTKKKIRRSDSNSSSSTITTTDPITNKKVTKINPNHSAYRNVQDPNGDYMWLFSGMR